jgi:hypothetical protein
MLKNRNQKPKSQKLYNAAVNLCSKKKIKLLSILKFINKNQTLQQKKREKTLFFFQLYKLRARKHERNKNIKKKEREKQ